MQLGHHLIGGEAVPADGATFHATNPATGERLEPAFPEADAGTVDRAAELAWEAFGEFRRTDADTRARLLEEIADRIEASADEVADAMLRETGLPTGRAAGETARTTGQLRLFARIVREGAADHVVVETALPDRTPLPRPDLRQRSIALGPVAVFGASNFPLAFSVAGGDTASALAAGAPVVVKAHPSHPATSEVVGRAITEAVAAVGLHPGTFSLLHGTTHELGAALVSHPKIRAVGFTGSRTGGLALVRAAQARPVPIPVYAEMSAVNPVFVLDTAAAARGDAIADGLVASVTGSGGQLCTKPGIVFVPEGSSGDHVVEAAAQGISQIPAITMLSAAIRDAYDRSTARFAETKGVDLAAEGPESDSATGGRPRLLTTDLATFGANPQLAEEAFGPGALVVRTPRDADLGEVVDGLEGQLTATVHADAGDTDAAAELLGHLELIAGRVILNGWPTGVDVGEAMVHGGPFPATSAPATTSVGARAIERWLRPVVYQNLPADLMPAPVQTAQENA